MQGHTVWYECLRLILNNNTPEQKQAEGRNDSQPILENEKGIGAEIQEGSHDGVCFVGSMVKQVQVQDIWDRLV